MFRKLLKVHSDGYYEKTGTMVSVPSARQQNFASKTKEKISGHVTKASCACDKPKGLAEFKTSRERKKTQETTCYTVVPCSTSHRTKKSNIRQEKICSLENPRNPCRHNRHLCPTTTFYHPTSSPKQNCWVKY